MKRAITLTLLALLPVAACSNNDSDDGTRSQAVYETIETDEPAVSVDLDTSGWQVEFPLEPDSISQEGDLFDYYSTSTSWGLEAGETFLLVSSATLRETGIITAEELAADGLTSMNAAAEEVETFERDGLTFAEFDTLASSGEEIANIRARFVVTDTHALSITVINGPDSELPETFLDSLQPLDA